MDEFELWVTKTTKGVIWTVVQIYVKSSRLILLFLVRTYDEGPQDIHFANSIVDVHRTTGRTLLFEIPSG
jgi:hypothetical protein